MQLDIKCCILFSIHSWTFLSSLPFSMWTDQNQTLWSPPSVVTTLGGHHPYGGHGVMLSLLCILTLIVIVNWKNLRLHPSSCASPSLWTIQLPCALNIRTGNTNEIARTTPDFECSVRLLKHYTTQPDVLNPRLWPKKPKVTISQFRL